MKVGKEPNGWVGGTNEPCSDMSTSEKSRASTDLIVLSILSIVVLIIAIKLELFEKIIGWTVQYEDWQVGELLSLLIVLPVALAIFALRRWREYRHELTRRIQADELLQRSHSELENRFKERTKDLREVKERFAHILSSNPAVIYTTKPDGDYGATFISANITSQLGYEPREFLEDSSFWESHIHPEDVQGVLDRISQLFEQGHHVHEFRFRHKDGSYRWILDQINLIRDENGTPVEIMGSWTDITEQKNAEATVRQQRDFLQQLIDTIPTPIFYKDREGRYQGCNNAFEIDTGMSRANLVGKTAFDVAPPDLAQIYYEEDLSLLRNPGVQRGENRRQNAAGKMHEVMFTKGTFSDLEGNVAGLVGVIFDITERKRAEEALRKTKDEVELRVQERTAELKKLNEDLLREIAERNAAEQALRESEERYRGLVENSNDIVFQIDTKGFFTFVNRFACRISGYSEEELVGLHFTDLILPEYKEETRKFYGRQLVKKIPITYYEFPFETKNGEVKWVGQNVQSITREDEIVGFQSIARDITKRKKAEEALQWNETLLRQLATTSPLAYLVVDNRTDEILYFNPQFCEMWGIEHLEDRMKRGELKNNDIIPECIPLIKNLEAFIASCKPLQSEEDRSVVEDEIEFVDDRTIRRFSTQLRDDLDRYFGRFYIFEDISDRKRAENLLRESESRYRALFENCPDGILIAPVETKRFDYANPSVCRMLGYTPEELMALGVESIHPHDQLPKVMAEFEAQARGEKVLAPNLPCLRKDGTVFYADISTSAAVLGGRACNVGFFRDITERKRQEEALHDSEERFRAFFEATFEAIFMSHEGVCIDQNLAGEKMFGYSTEEAVGVFGTEVISPEYRDLVVKNMLSGYEEPYEAVGLRKDGTTFPCEIQGKMFDYQGRRIRVTAIRDITERKKAEEALRESEQRFRTLVEKAPLAIAFSRNLKFAYVNPEFLEMTGFTDPAELEGQSITNRIAPQDLTEFTQRARRRENGLPAETRYEAIGVRKDGSQFPFEAFVTRLSLSDGDVTAGFFHDITERKRAERERETLRAQLLQAQKMEAIGTLTGGIAHDFNNLLTIMNGYTELILSEKTEGDPICSHLKKILETGRRGAEMVQRLMGFSKKADINPRPLDLNSIVEEAINLMEGTFPKMIEIETILAGDLRQVNADPGQVEQVLMNLCINAKEAMSDGGRLRIETKNIAVDKAYCARHVGAKPGPHVLIEVSDTGSGMSRETIERMFDPFFTTKGWDFKKGTGLGLSVTKGIVEQHGGWITCNSEQGKGTVFTVYFPAIETQPEYKKPEIETTATTEDKKILLVDDEEYVRDLGKRILERAGHTVITASNGMEALDLYKREQSNIGLVILDLIMPQMSGEKCLEELLKINPNVKVIVSSGHSLTAQERMRLGVHVIGFANKPYQFKEFLDVVKEVLAMP